MQGLADGYFIIPYTLGNYLASTKLDKVGDRPRRVQGRRGRGRATGIKKLLAHQGQADASTTSTATSASIMWDDCGMARNEQGLEDGPGEDPGAARGVLAGRHVSWATAAN